MTTVLTGRWSFLLATSLGRAAVGFQFQATPALAQAMNRDLGFGLAEVGTLTGLYMLPGFAVAILAGTLLQILAVRTALLFGLAAMILAGLIGYGAEGFAHLAWSRLIGGAGGVLLVVATLKGLSDWFDVEQLPTANGISGACQPFGMGCGLFVFSALGPEAAWRLAILSTAIVSGLLLLLVLAVVRDAPLARTPTGAGIGLPRREWYPLGLATLIVALYGGCFYAFLSLFPSYLHVHGWAPIDIAWLMAVLGWAPIIVAPLGGFLASRTGYQMPIIAVSIAMWSIALAAIMSLGVSLWLIAFMLVFGPLPLGSVMSLPVRAVAPERRGLASGLFIGGFFAGTALMPMLSAWIGELAVSMAQGPETVAITFCAAAFMTALVPLAFFTRFTGAVSR